MSAATTPSIWDFSDYKSFLKAWIAAQPHRGHGSKAAIARVAHCQTAYISQVVLASAHLSLEQAERVSAFLGLSEDETHFFLLLIQQDRAGTESLRRYFSKQVKVTLNLRTQLKNRVDKGVDLPLDAQVTYFSSWIYPSVHLLTRISSFSKPETISRRLGLPLRVVEEVLQFLESVGLIAREKGRFAAGPSRMHLPHDSPLVAKHHLNWRMKSIRDLEQVNEESLHYSSVVTLSKEDVTHIKEMLMKTVETAKQAIQTSSDEVLYCFCLDFFEV